MTYPSGVHPVVQRHWSLLLIQRWIDDYCMQWIPFPGQFFNLFSVVWQVQDQKSTFWLESCYHHCNKVEELCCQRYTGKIRFEIWPLSLWARTVALTNFPSSCDIDPDNGLTSTRESCGPSHLTVTMLTRATHRSLPIFDCSTSKFEITTPFLVLFNKIL